jgi:hypothetical protein
VGREEGIILKHSFEKWKRGFFDPALNTTFGRTSFNKSHKNTLSQKMRDKYLSDLGTGSSTELESARNLNEHYDRSPEFIEWLVKRGNNAKTHIEWNIVWALWGFKGDKRVRQALLKSARKCPDEAFHNYPTLLAEFGGNEAFEILWERFERIRKNPVTFKKVKPWNDLASVLIEVSCILYFYGPNRERVANCLLKLSDHPDLWEREITIRRLAEMSKRGGWLLSFELFDELMKKVDSLMSSRNNKLFLAALPRLFYVQPEKAYQKFKRLYLQASEPERYSRFVFELCYTVANPIGWIARIVKELTEKDTFHFREYLYANRVTIFPEEKTVAMIKEGFQSPSPYTRFTTIRQLSQIDSKIAMKLVKDALKDEPDEFIQKKLKDYLK